MATTKTTKKPKDPQATAPVDAAESPAPPEPAIIPSYEWLNGGKEVLLLKCVNADGLAYGGFKWPLEVGASVEAPDWDPRPVCGGGLHGWAWGIGIGGGKDPDWAGVWIVYGSDKEDVVHITDSGGKEKSRRGIVRFVSQPGDWQAATNFILAGQIAWVQQASSGAASATGYRGAASATGYSGAAIAGYCGRARAGKFGCVAIAWWNESEKRQEMRCREVGCGDGTDGKLKACVWYRLNPAGEFIEEAA